MIFEVKTNRKLDSKVGLHHEWVLWTWTLYWNTESLKVLPFRWWIIQWIGDSVQFSHSVMSYSLWPYGLQHSRLPCPSPTPRSCSNSCPLSWWYHPTISSSVIPFSFRLQPFPTSGFFQGVSSLHQVAKVLEFQVQHQSFQWIFRTDFLYDWLVGSLCSRRDSQESSPTSQFQSINSFALSFHYITLD